MTVRVIDIETTGTDPTVDAIIEIASVDLLKDGTIANQRTALVQPPLPVPPEASAVHRRRRGKDDRSGHRSLAIAPHWHRRSHTERTYVGVASPALTEGLAVSAVERPPVGIRAEILQRNVPAGLDRSHHRGVVRRTSRCPQ
jgi:hypothetical protein